MSKRLHLLLGLTAMFAVACHEESAPETPPVEEAKPSPSAKPSPPPPAASPTPEPVVEAAPPPHAPDTELGPPDICHNSHHCIYSDSSGHIHLLREGEQIPAPYVARAPAIEEMARERHWQVAAPVETAAPTPPPPVPTPSTTPAVVPAPAPARIEPKPVESPKPSESPKPKPPV